MLQNINVKSNFQISIHEYKSYTSHRSKLRNHYYAYPPLALMTQKGVTPNWRRPPFPLNIKYFVPQSTQNLI